MRQWINVATMLRENTSGDKPWFHGTNSLKKLQGIAKHGLTPGTSVYRGALKSQKGMVYLTSSFIVASDYSHRGNDTNHIYIAQFDPPSEVFPDEDDIVSFMSRNTDFNTLGFRGDAGDKPVWDFVAGQATPEELAGCQFPIRHKEGRKALMLAKRAQNTMPQTIRDILLLNAWKVAHHGTIKPSACWVVPKANIKHINQDGSNLIEYAERIPR